VLAAAEAQSLNRLRQVAVDNGVEHEWLEGAALFDAVPLLAQGRCHHGVHLPTGGVLDIHTLGETLRRQLVLSQISMRTSSAVDRISVGAGRVDGVLLASGERIRASRVVIAAGAWSGLLGASCGCALPLTP